MRIEERPEVVELEDLPSGAEPSVDAPDDRGAIAPRRPGRSRRTVAFVFLAIAFGIASFLVFEFGLSSLAMARSQRVLLTQFRALADQGPASTVDWQPALGQPIGILSIPRLGVSAVVVEGTSSSDTAEGPGHYAGSPLPGRPGNAVIAGRRASFGAPFSHLAELQQGDEIQVATGVGTFTYRVTGHAIIRPNDLDALNATTDNRLTLMTSDPKYRASGRLVVTASLLGLPAPQAQRPITVVPQDQVGLTGQPWALAPLLLWIELLVVTIVGAIWLRHRQLRRVAWLYATPLVLGLMWASFLAINRLLPATL
jgi:sortase A